MYSLYWLNSPIKAGDGHWVKKKSRKVVMKFEQSKNYMK